MQLLYPNETAMVCGATECWCRWSSQHNFVRHVKVKVSDIINPQTYNCLTICCYQYNAESYQFYGNSNTYADLPTSCLKNIK